MFHHKKKFVRLGNNSEVVLAVPVQPWKMIAMRIKVSTGTESGEFVLIKEPKRKF